MTTKVHILSGVESARPFQIRRLGHFGVNVESPEKSLHFYRDLLGFKVSDQIDFADRLPPELKNQIGPTVGFFTRHGTDHHSFVLFPKKAVEKVNPQYARFPQLTANQLTWQVGSLQEIVDAFSWFTDQAIPIIRSGRDLPGSNWHFYPTDPAGHINELYYGIEQIGWSGHSKALAMHDVKFQQPPNLPYHSEYAEVNRAIANQINIHAGWRDQSNIEETYPVDGVLMARPFKIIKMGPVRLFVDDLSAAKDFYTRIMGLRLTEEIKYQGYSCYFLSSNTEHHALAIYPTALRTILGLNPSSTTFAFAMQVASYQQLRTMYHYLKEAGVTIQPIPHELSPGLGHHFYAALVAATFGKKKEINEIWYGYWAGASISVISVVIGMFGMISGDYLIRTTMEKRIPQFKRLLIYYLNHVQTFCTRLNEVDFPRLSQEVENVNTIDEMVSIIRKLFGIAKNLLPEMILQSCY